MFESVRIASLRVKQVNLIQHAQRTAARPFRVLTLYKTEST